jgi:hypothetical protein
VGDRLFILVLRTRKTLITEISGKIDKGMIYH